MSELSKTRLRREIGEPRKSTISIWGERASESGASVVNKPIQPLEFFFHSQFWYL